VPPAREKLDRKGRKEWRKGRKEKL
jgi:hypothetical protein